jgi:hypothetical protein
LPWSGLVRTFSLNKRFDMPGFVPRADWVREMKHYDVLPGCVEPRDVTDVYAVEQDYWKSLWHEPALTRSDVQARR